MAAEPSPAESSLQLQLGGIAERLVDIAGHVASEAETATAVVRGLSDQIGRMAALVSGLEAAANLMETGVRQQADALAQARLSLTKNGPVIAALEQSAASVASISTVISLIAQESRTLSLNARIEAARSGSGGSAFAVVATEMATLTARTKQATDDIKDRSSAIAREVGSANDIVDAHAKLVVEQDDLLT